MKKILSLFVLFAALSVVACKNEKKGDKAETKTDAPQKVEDATKSSAAPASAAVTAHSCSADCKDGNHMYTHNQVGHTCTDACGAAHGCKDQCKEGKHVYAHGESGHTCVEGCMQS